MRSDCNHSSIATSALNRNAAPQKAFAPSLRLFSRKELFASVKRLMLISCIWGHGPPCIPSVSNVVV